MKFRSLSLLLASLTTIFLTATTSADDLQYPRHPVVSSAPEMSTHLGQFGLPGIRPPATVASTRLAQIGEGGAEYLIANADRPTAAEGLAKLPVDAKAEGRRQRGVFASAEYLNWTLRRRDQDFAISSDPGAIVISGGEIHELQYQGAPGFRSTLGYRLSNGWKVGVVYTGFETESSGTAEDGLGTLYATRSHPDLNRRAGLASAQSSFDMTILDLEVRNSLTLGDRATLTLLGSFRWADVGQAFSVTYDGIDFPQGGTVTSLASQDGFGLRIGATARWDVTDHLYLIGGADTSLLHSNTSISLNETNGATSTVDVADTYSQVLPVLAASAGAGVQLGDLTLEAGYEMQAWFDLGDRMGFLDDQHLGIFSHTNHNLLMDGFYLRLGWDY
jgi:hypothetical protein